MKKTIAVLFGGRSSEHEVSCVSIQNVVNGMDPGKYEPVLLGITKEGRWLLAESVEDIASGAWRERGIPACISPDSSRHCVQVERPKGTETIPIDAVFPVLHGTNGEDGTVQGLLEMAGIPYVGCGVLASAVSMDKIYTKIIVDTLGICQARSLALYQEDYRADPEGMCGRIGDLGYPVFIKPSNAGSSCGVTKVTDPADLPAALEEAFRFDRKALAEETIVGREVECGVLGAKRLPGGIRSSGVGEILAAAEFYDYDAKYNNPESQTVIDPDLPQAVKDEIRRDAERIFAAVDGFGLARVDFFVREDGTVVFSEINTMPGFTGISMYPMLWNAEGISMKELTGTLIEMAFKR